MPRSNGVYSEPAGTKATPNTTIQSAPYNAFVDDLVGDANAPRPLTAGGTGATNATAARENLGLKIGEHVQAYDPALQSIASLVTTANMMLYTTGTDVWTTTALTPFARSILDDADAAAVRSTIDAQKSIGYAPANKAGENFTGSISAPNLIVSFDGPAIVLEDTNPGSSILLHYQGGIVGFWNATEDWRFQVSPTGEIRTPLIPDGLKATLDTKLNANIAVQPPYMPNIPTSGVETTNFNLLVNPGWHNKLVLGTTDGGWGVASYGWLLVCQYPGGQLLQFVFPYYDGAPWFRTRYQGAWSVWKRVVDGPWLEARAQAWANDRVANMALRRVYGGFTEYTAAYQSVPAGAFMTGGAFIEHSASIQYYYLQMYDPVRGWVATQG